MTPAPGPDGQGDRPPDPLEFDEAGEETGPTPSTAESSAQSTGEPATVLPPLPETASRLTQAREARDIAQEITSDAYRALWREVALWPLKHGTLLAVLILAALSAVLSLLDGGATQDARTFQAFLKIPVGVAALVVLGIYARRIVWSTVEGDRPVAWFRDRSDDTPWTGAVTQFAACAVTCLMPFGIFLVVDFVMEFRPFVTVAGAVALALLGGAQLPLALVATTVQGKLTAALPHKLLRIWRAEPHASRVAAATSVAFAVVLLVTFLLADGFNPDDPTRMIDDHTAVRTTGRVTLGVLRLAAFYCALVSFRVAGLLVRDVPEVREALK